MHASVRAITARVAPPRRDGFVADAALVDGSHTFHNVFVDLYFLRQIVRPGGLVILDGCNHSSVARAVRYFEGNAGWQCRPMAPLRRNPTAVREVVG